MRPTKEECYWLMEKFPMLYNVRMHSELVTDVAVYLAEELNKRSFKLDLGVVEAGALLHDIAKTYSILERLEEKKRYIKENGIMKEISLEELTQRWEKIGLNYGVKMNDKHADVGAKLIEPERYNDRVVTCIRNHTRYDIDLSKIEEYHIVYYADKRIMDEKVVSVETRFELLRGRYKGVCCMKSMDLCKETTEKIEEMIFRNLKNPEIKPEDLQNILNPN